jgi:thiol:disulfide interchange protein DsbC
VKGSGKRILYTFEDPNCSYCKRLQLELEKVTDVTIYTFLMPILSQDSVEKSRAVWCAPDRAKAWDDLMLRAALPEGGKACNTPIERNLQLMRRFGIRGTPAIYLANGQHIGGFIPGGEAGAGAEHRRTEVGRGSAQAGVAVNSRPARR